MSIRFHLLFIFALLASLLGGATTYTPARAAGILFVKPFFNGTGDCNSWANACKLQMALSAAAAGDQIWVQAGVHKPDFSNRTVSFRLKNGVAIYGGFLGTETQLGQRDPAANVTTLSGDLNGDDNGFLNNGENSIHVVVGSNTDKTAVLDGFTIRGGNANGGSLSGGGMYNDTGSPTLGNLTFTGNFAQEIGGGMANYLGTVEMTNVIFSGNSAGVGGALYNNESNLTLLNATFADNFSSSDGGAILSEDGSSLVLTNVTFSNNFASSMGGGMYSSGTDLILENVTFSGNAAGNTAGGMFTHGVSPRLTNVTFSGNSATTGGGMYNQNSAPTLINTIIANSNGGDCVNAVSGSLDASSSNNLIEDPSNACGLQPDNPNGNIIGSDPKLGPLSNNGGTTQTHALLAGSLALDHGRSDENCPATDQRGVTRPQGSQCDIGAFEYAISTISGSAGASGVTLSYTDGTPRTVLSAANGSYSLTVSDNWSGIVIPSHICFTFNPPGRSYSNIITNQTAQNYSAIFNPVSNCAEVAVKIRETTRGTYAFLRNTGGRLSYAVDSGPVFVNSTGKNNIRFVASERVAYFNRTLQEWTHFSEMMGLPAQLKSTKYSFPAYDNIAFNSQLRFANVGTANTTVTVTVGGVLKGNYPLSPNQSTKIGYAGLSGGPVVVQSTNTTVPIIASLRVVPLTLNGRYSEIIGVPQSLVSNTYVFPWYNNKDLDTQLRVGNIGAGTTTITVTVGGVTVGTFPLTVNESRRVRFANVNGGPVKVTSAGNVPIVASLRVAFQSGTTWTGFSEIMGLPQSQLDTIYTFPWYNNKELDSQLRFANMSGATATIHVYIGGVEMAGSPFSLAAGASTRKSFPNVNGGPVEIVSNQSLVTSLRILFKSGTTITNFSELMGLPQKQLQATTGYIFPWYNNVGLNTQLRIGVP